MSREEWEENDSFTGKYKGKEGTFVIQYQDDDSWSVEHLVGPVGVIGGRGVRAKGDNMVGSQYLHDEEGNISWDTRIEAMDVAARHAGLRPPKPLADRRGLVAHSRELYG